MSTLNLVWLVFFWGWFAVEVFLLLRTRVKQSTHDRGSLRILWGTIAVSMSVGITYGEFTRIHLPYPYGLVIRYIALGILILGLAVRIWAIRTLGKSFTVNVALHSEQKVIQHGLFRYVRHPSYLGMMLIYFASGLYERSLISMAIILIPISFALAYRINVEEQALRAGFGDEYVAYSKRTKRLIPFVY